MKQIRENRNDVGLAQDETGVDGAAEMTAREARTDTGMSQWHLQKKARVHQSRISLIERGLVDPTSKERQAIAAALGLSVDQIDWDVQ
jgi:predicted transcriptional regulator